MPKKIFVTCLEQEPEQLKKMSIKLTGGPRNTKTRTGREWWNALARGGWPPSREQCDGLKLAYIEKSGPQEATVGGGWQTFLDGWPSDVDDIEPPWIRIILPEFTLRERQDVVFQLEDVECLFWKRGIFFDFIELRKCG
jgi:hypothetical protein